jgi:DNA (cytosine-5)-methyltransferase 1
LTASRVLPRIVSLFSGAGGLDLGFRQARFRLAAAFDNNPASVATYRRNFPRVRSILADLRVLGPDGVLNRIADRVPPGASIGIIGGPPCQGFSRANTMALVSDARNSLTTTYLDIVEGLSVHYDVKFVVFENVLGITDRKHADHYEAFRDRLATIGYAVYERRVFASDFGVPQRRPRLLVCGFATRAGYSVKSLRRRTGTKTVRQAIGGITTPPAFYRRDLRVEDIPHHPNHWTMQPKSARFREGTEGMDGRSFKRLSWDAPSPTVAFGHREIHIHPTGTRRLSVYEAKLLQGFPPSFVISGNLSQQVDQVSNAVPPPLARSVANSIRRSLQTK